MTCGGDLLGRRRQIPRINAVGEGKHTLACWTVAAFGWKGERSVRRKS